MFLMFILCDLIVKMWKSIEISGLTFLGWYDSEGNKVTKIEGRTGDLVLTPRFELNSDANLEDPDKNPDGDAGNQNGSDSDNSNGNEGLTEAMVLMETMAQMVRIMLVEAMVQMEHLVTDIQIIM